MRENKYKEFKMKYYVSLIFSKKSQLTLTIRTKESNKNTKNWFLEKSCWNLEVKQEEEFLKVIWLRATFSISYLLTEIIWLVKKYLTKKQYDFYNQISQKQGE